MPECNLTLRRASGHGRICTVLAVAGYVDASTVDELDETLAKLREHDTGDLVVDCGDLLYVNSRGMGTLITAYNEFLQKHKELVLIRVRDEVLRLMKVIGLHDIIPIFPSLDEALDYFASAPAGRRVRPTPPEEKPEREEKKSIPHKTETAIMLITPWRSAFNEVLQMHLQKEGQFEIVQSCDRALEIMDVVDPDLVILEDSIEGAEDFVVTLKTEKRRSINPVIRLYQRGADRHIRRSFKVWEDDYLVEPFDVVELFRVAEQNLNQSPLKHKGLLHHTHFTFQSTPENVDKANQVFGGIVDQMDFSALTASEIKSAFAEAIDNAMKHGNRNIPSKRIDVHVLADREKLSVRVEDEGDGFDYRRYLDEISRDPEGFKRRLEEQNIKGGRGILLMLSCTDKLVYGGGGKVVTMIKNF